MVRLVIRLVVLGGLLLGLLPAKVIASEESFDAAGEIAWAADVALLSVILNQEPPSPGWGLILEPACGNPGTRVTARVSRPPEGATTGAEAQIAVRWDSPSASAQARIAQGQTQDISFIVPPGAAPGTHTVTLVLAPQPATLGLAPLATATFTVPCPQPIISAPPSQLLPPIVSPTARLGNCIQLQSAPRCSTAPEINSWVQVPAVHRERLQGGGSSGGVLAAQPAPSGGGSWQPTVPAAPAPFPEVPVIPEADSLALVAGGLVALGALATLRARRRGRVLGVPVGPLQVRDQ